MRSWSKQLCVLVGSYVLMGCATNDDGGAPSSGSGMKVAANSCMTQVEGDRKQCEQKCPAATGNEHFSMQHRLAMENTACKEQCAAQGEQQAMACKSSR